MASAVTKLLPTEIGNRIGDVGDLIDIAALDIGASFTDDFGNNAELNRFNQKFKACIETAAFLASDTKFKEKYSFSMTEYISKGKLLLNSHLDFHVRKSLHLHTCLYNFENQKILHT